MLSNFEMVEIVELMELIEKLEIKVKEAQERDFGDTSNVKSRIIQFCFIVNVGSLKITSQLKELRILGSRRSTIEALSIIIHECIQLLDAILENYFSYETVEKYNQLDTDFSIVWGGFEKFKLLEELWN